MLATGASKTEQAGVSWLLTPFAAMLVSGKAAYHVVVPCGATLCQRVGELWPTDGGLQRVGPSLAAVRIGCFNADGL
jgi:hypothetical protein